MNAMQAERARLSAILERETGREVPAPVRALAEAVRRRHGSTVLAVLFYGSGLRRDDVDDLVLDFYVLVERYRPAFARRSWALLAALLPPNVLYREAAVDGRTLRCKYAVISLRQFHRGADARAATPYIWARFAQPCRIVYARDDAARRAVVEALADAAVAFMRESLPLLAGEHTAREVWARGLALTYRTELRAEPPDRVAALYDASAAHFERVTPPAARLCGVPLGIDGGSQPPRLDVRPSAAMRAVARLRWLLRVPLGKVLSLARLMKSAITFEGAADYVLWKIERHSGVHVEASPWQRRHPLIGGWGVLWRLYRRGAFR